MSFNDPAEIEGRTVLSTDGDKIGKVDVVFIDTDTQKPEWAAVSTGMFGHKVSLVPLAAATTLPSGDLQVPFDKAKIKGAPNHEPDQELSEADEAELFSYYGVPYGGRSVTATGGPQAAAGRDVPSEQADRATEGHDMSGPTTDEAMTRSEERLQVGTERVEAGRARLRKYVVTEQVTQTVPVSHEEIRVEREPITDASRGSATDGPAISEEEHEVVLHAEQPVVAKETVPVERVRLGTETVAGEQSVTEEVRKEQVDLNDAEAETRSSR